MWLERDDMSLGTHLPSGWDLVVCVLCHNVQLNPAITVVRGLTSFIYYVSNSIIGGFLSLDQL